MLLKTWTACSIVTFVHACRPEEQLEFQHEMTRSSTALHSLLSRSNPTVAEAIRESKMTTPESSLTLAARSETW